MLVIECDGVRFTSRDRVRDAADRVLRIVGVTSAGLVLLAPVSGGQGAPLAVRAADLFDTARYTPVALEAAR